MSLRLTTVEIFLKCFIMCFSSVNYCLFLILKYCRSKVNSLPVRRSGFFLLEVVVALALSLCVISFFGLSLGQALYRLRYQRDRLTALLCARSALNHCLIYQRSPGVFNQSYSQFSIVVTCQRDSSYHHLLSCVSTASWPSGSVSIQSGVVI